MDDIRRAAHKIRTNAYAPYSGFKVGAAIKTDKGNIFVGVNVENVAFPEGTCAEAGAIAAMVTAGDKRIKEAYIVADSPSPVPPCGGCRQKIAEFAEPDVVVTLATCNGQEKQYRISDLLPGVFTAEHMRNHP